MYAITTLTSIPAEVFAIILSSLTFVEIARNAEVSQQMRDNVEFFMRNVDEIHDTVSVNCIAYVVL